VKLDNLKIHYKIPSLEGELRTRNAILRRMVSDFCFISWYDLGIVPTVTRILGKIEGDSGVHASGRAVDFRSVYMGAPTYTDEQVDHLLKLMNQLWDRNDSKKTLIHHSFSGGPKHWHLQTASKLEVYDV
jgi:hypothetical protein